MKSQRKSVSGIIQPVPPSVTSTFRELINNLPGSLKSDYLKAEIFSKYVDESTDPADLRRDRAIAKWLVTEEANALTNERLLLTPEEYNILPRVTFGQFTAFCQDIIRDILGDVVPEDALIGTFSGGASTSRNRTCSHPAGKYLGQADVTSSAYEIFEDLLDDIPGWDIIGARTDFRIVPGNVMFTVPKKTDIDRCACKEPDINMWLQKGIGSFIRKRLRVTGINLNDQSINRSLARKGSFDGSLATLDLSSASDSVTEQLVALMLPVNWFTILDSIRSRVTNINGEEHRNEMFSSMGNGFTFELESLLFYALARTTAYFRGIPGVISVYGDDIIVPTPLYDDLVWVLKYFGFSVNSDKSWHSGPFRESCGGHYSDGYDITPFYIKEPIRTLPQLIDVANKLRKWAEIETLSVLDPSVEPIWLWLKSLVPQCLWGGADVSFRYQLVSSDLAVCRIQEDTRRSSTGYGGYLHWLNATWDRDGVSDGVVTSSKQTNQGHYRLRKVRPDSATVARLEREFLSEIHATPSREGS